MSAYQLVLLLVLAVLIAGILFLLLLGPRRRTPPDSAFPDDDRYWHLGGAIYYNPDDPDLIIPRRYTGWTLKLGHPVGRLIIVGILVLIVVLAILPVLVPGINASGFGGHPPGCSGLP